MVLFILEKNIDSDSFIKMCLKKYLDLTKELNISSTKFAYVNDFLDKIEINRDKKPCFIYNNEPVDIYFNLSHTDGVMVLLMGDKECGVDVEKIIDRNYQAISKRENFNVSSLDEFYDMWTKCEAYVKLNGKGITNIKDNKEFALEKVKTINIIKGYKISLIPFENLLISILT